MPPTRREVERAIRESPPSAAAETQYWKSILQSAAVSSEHLTQSPEWNAYLEKLQVLLNDAKVSAATWLERLGGAMEDKDVRVAQFNYQAAHARVKTLEEVMALPSELIQLHKGSATA